MIFIGSFVITILKEYLPICSRLVSLIFYLIFVYKNLLRILKTLHFLLSLTVKSIKVPFCVVS